MRWFRVYSDLVDDPKFIKLGPDLRSALLMAWCVASSNDGILPCLENVAIKFRLSPSRTKKLLDELIRCNLLDEIERDGQVVVSPHNWDGRQYKSDSSAERMKRHRKRHRDVTVTPPDTDTDTDTERKKESPSLRSVEDGWPRDSFERFWLAYPRKVAKHAAEKALDKVRKSGEVPFDRVLSAIGTINTKDEKFIPHPATWLNQGRYLDGQGSAPKAEIGEVVGGYVWDGSKWKAPDPIHLEAAE